jgi:hypothetical protein
LRSRDNSGQSRAVPVDEEKDVAFEQGEEAAAVTSPQRASPVWLKLPLLTGVR